MSQALVIDTETSLKNKGDGSVGTFQANPHHPDNWIVWAGLAKVNLSSPYGISGRVLKKWASKEEFEGSKARLIPPRNPNTVLIGHNIKYDLLFLMKGDTAVARLWQDWVRNPASKVWDTMIAQYRLLGQTQINPSLDFCASIARLPTKPGRLKEYWNAGISTEEIPDNEVEPYLEHDLSLPAQLFARQLRNAAATGMIGLLQEEMGALLMTTAAEFDGMKFDFVAAQNKLEQELWPAIHKAEAIARSSCQILGVPTQAINLGSPKMVNVMMFGGKYKYQIRESLFDDDGNPVLFKTGAKKGMPRYKINKMEWSATPATRCPVKTTGIDDLKRIAQHASTAAAAKQFITDLLEWRKLTKQASTYYVGYSKLTWPHDGCIHGNLNHCVTATGRLSASNPNIQNAAHTDIREFFVSREEDGRLAEIDLSQIEIVVQGVLSGDKNMMADLHAGIDFHSKRAAGAWGGAKGMDYAAVKAAVKAEDPYWMKKRKAAKIFSFQRAYGAGPALIADYTGMTMAEVKKLIKVEEEMYPDVVAMQERWQNEVHQSARKVHTSTWGKMKSPTGAVYMFEREEFNGKPSFRPTAIKNYQIQGLAGDIIKVILNNTREVMHNWQALHDVYFINTVHDSLIFDLGGMNDLAVDQFTAAIHKVMTAETEAVLKNKFGLDFQGLIKADIDVGHNWYGSSESNPLGMRGWNYEDAA